MQNEYRVMTWNIKGSASLGWDGQRKVKEEVVKKIIEQRAHVIILTEFVVTRGIDYLFEQFQEKNYIWFITSCTGKNGVLIAIKKDLIDNTELKKRVYHDNIIASEFEGCNILKVTVPMNCGKNLCIIGCRMETGGEKNLQANYDMEKECFDNIMLPHIRPIKQENLYIVGGDFNNARCLGTLNERFNRTHYNGKPQCNYNLNIIKDTFDDIGFTMVDVDGNGNAIPTHKGYFPEDHIFIRGLQSKSVGTIPSDKLSDHDILWSEVRVE